MEALRLELAYFVDCIVKNEAPFNDGQAGLRRREDAGGRGSVSAQSWCSGRIYLNPSIPAERPLLSLSNNSTLLQQSTQDGIATMPENSYTCVTADVKLGRDVKLSKFINLYGCEIGDETKIGAFVEVQKNAKIGKRCKISSHTFVCEGVTIEDNVFIGHGVTFINDSYPRATSAEGQIADRSRLESGALLWSKLGPQSVPVRLSFPG